MASRVRLYGVYVVKSDRGVDMREHRPYTEPNIILYTSTHDHLLYSRNVQLKSRIRNYTVYTPSPSDKCQSHTP